MFSAFEFDEEVEILVKSSQAWSVWSSLTHQQRQNVIDTATSIVKNRIDEQLCKGKVLPVGTIRTYNGHKFVKHADGWVGLSGGKQGKLVDFKTGGKVHEKHDDKVHGSFAKQHADKPEGEPKETSKESSGEAKGGDVQSQIDEYKAEIRKLIKMSDPRSTSSAHVKQANKRIGELNKKIEDLKGSAGGSGGSSPSAKPKSAVAVKDEMKQKVEQATQKPSKKTDKTKDLSEAKDLKTHLKDLGIKSKPYKHGQGVLTNREQDFYRTAKDLKKQGYKEVSSDIQTKMQTGGDGVRRMTLEHPEHGRFEIEDYGDDNTLIKFKGK